MFPIFTLFMLNTFNKKGFVASYLQSRVFRMIDIIFDFTENIISMLYIALLVHRKCNCERIIGIIIKTSNVLISLWYWNIVSSTVFQSLNAIKEHA